jgi:DNA-binding NarL/FixJ family response regulator
MSGPRRQTDIPVIEVEHLHKQYRDQVAVDDLSFTVERGEIFGVLEAGATGYLLKDAPREELIRAVRAAFAGEAVLSPAVASRLMGQVGKPPPKVLSQRELEVLALIADGATNRQAAAKLFVSEATVKTHLLHIYEKLGVRDRAAAVAEAYRRRLLT